MTEPVLRPEQPDMLAGAELERRSARKDGRELATLRCVEIAGVFVIECDVYPVDGLRVDPLRPGPYRFATRQEADAFIDEVVTSLTYLGCELT